MIKGKAKAEFGTGDIKITATMSCGVGGLCLQEDGFEHEVGSTFPVENADRSVKEADIILTFTKTESIDTLVKDLLYVKDMMNGVANDSVVHDVLFDYNAFIE